MNLENNIKEHIGAIADPKERLAELNRIRKIMSELSPCHEQPVDCVIWVPVEMVEPNDYNPNSVANK